MNTFTLSKTVINIKGKCMHCGNEIKDRKTVHIFEDDRQYCTYCCLVATSYSENVCGKSERSYIPEYVYDKEKGKGYLIASNEGMKYIFNGVAEIMHKLDRFVINSFTPLRSLKIFYLNADDSRNILLEKNDAYSLVRFPSDTNVSLDDYLEGKYYSSYISAANDLINCTKKNEKGLVKYLVRNDRNIMGIIAFNSKEDIENFSYEKCMLYSRTLSIIGFGEKISEKKQNSEKYDVNNIDFQKILENLKQTEKSDKRVSENRTHHADTSEEKNETAQFISFRNTLSRKIYEALKDIDFSEMLDYFRSRIKGQDRELKVALHLVIRYLRFASGEMKEQAPNWMLTAPSGCGKTEFFRTVKEYFKLKDIPVPVLRIDLSRITEEGFKGSDPSSIMKMILNEDPYSEGIAICFLDEADKKCVPSYSTSGIDVNRAVQSNLLTIIEGIESRIETDSKGTHPIDTNLTMFVLVGAFQDIRNKKKAKKAPKKCVGFDTVPSEQKNFEAEKAFSEDIGIQEIIEYGMLEELAGRMMCIVNFKPIPENDMRNILICKTEEISKEFKNKIKLTENAVDEFLKISYGPLGMRAPMNKIKELAERCIADVFFDSCYDAENDTVIIDGLENAFITHSAKSKNTKKRFFCHD